MSHDLARLFSPRSIAVIGASQSPQKVGAITLKNIITSGFRGPIYPVNPHLDHLGNLKFYPNVVSLPEVPDLAVIAVPAPIAVNLLEDIGQKGIKNVVVFSAGFREIGSDGEALEQSLVTIAAKYQLNLLGPNCLGFANNSLPLNVTFGQVVNTPGKLRLISQSGAIAAALFDWFRSSNLGFDQFITIGNKSVITENDILEYWLNSGLSHSPIGIYLESITDGRRFISLLTELSRKNPIFILKPGKSVAAARAMLSHTGSIAGEDNVLDVALCQSGVIRCRELNDFFDLARTLSWETPPKGPRVAVVSNAGGPAVLTTDTVNEVGLGMAEFTPDTQAKLTECLPRLAGFLNPVDVLGDALAVRFGQALKIVLDEPAVDSALVILTPQLMTQIENTAEIIGKLSKDYQKPVYASFIGGGQTLSGEQILNRLHIPHFPFPERAVHTLAAVWSWQQWTNQHPPNPTTPSSRLNDDALGQFLAPALLAGQSALDNFAADGFITAAGIITPATLKVDKLPNALNFADQHGYPLVLKISSPGLLHKSDVGGVLTHISSSAQLKDAWKIINQKIPKLSDDIKNNFHLQIQQEIVSGVELIVGAKRDPTFGPVLLFGAGGKLAELISDRNLHLLPLDPDSARRLVASSKAFPLLNGYRGDAPLPLDGLYKLIITLGQILDQFPAISEIEINPVIVNSTGTFAVDTKVLL